MRVLFFLLTTVLGVSYAYPQEYIDGTNIRLDQNELAVYDAGIAEFKKIIKQNGWEKADIYITSFCDQDYAEDFYHDIVITRISFLDRRGMLDASIQEGKYVLQLENIRDQMPDPEMEEGVAQKLQSQCKLKGQ